MEGKIKRLILCIIVLFALIAIANFIYFYIIKAMQNAKKYTYETTEINMTSAMNVYFLSNGSFLTIGQKDKKFLSDLITGNYMNEKSVPKECDASKSYVIGTVDKNYEIVYKVCLKCEKYNSKNCS